MIPIDVWSIIVQFIPDEARFILNDTFTHNQLRGAKPNIEAITTPDLIEYYNIPINKDMYIAMVTRPNALELYQYFVKNKRRLTHIRAKQTFAARDPLVVKYLTSTGREISIDRAIKELNIPVLRVLADMTIYYKRNEVYGLTGKYDWDLITDKDYLESAAVVGFMEPLRCIPPHRNRICPHTIIQRWNDPKALEHPWASFPILYPNVSMSYLPAPIWLPVLYRTDRDEYDYTIKKLLVRRERPVFGTTICDYIKVCKELNIDDLMKALWYPKYTAELYTEVFIKSGICPRGVKLQWHTMTKKVLTHMIDNEVFALPPTISQLNNMAVDAIPLALTYTSRTTQSLVKKILHSGHNFIL